MTREYTTFQIVMFCMTIILFAVFGVSALFVILEILASFKHHCIDEACDHNNHMLFAFICALFSGAGLAACASESKPQSL